MYGSSDPSKVKTVVNDLQERAASGQSKAKEGKRSVESAGDARMSKKIKKDRH